MVKYAKILFPLDFSASAPIVAEHVAAMAVSFGSEIHVVHVIPGYEHHAFASYGRVMEEIKAGARKALDEFIGKHFGGMTAHASVLSGHTGRRLLEYIDKNDISLVVMGTHGRSELGKLIFGSVAQRVVQSSPAPVITINPDYEADRD